MAPTAGKVIGSQGVSGANSPLAGRQWSKVAPTAGKVIGSQGVSGPKWASVVPSGSNCRESDGFPGRQWSKVAPTAGKVIGFQGVSGPKWLQLQGK